MGKKGLLILRIYELMPINNPFMQQYTYLFHT